MGFADWTLCERLREGNEVEKSSSKRDISFDRWWMASAQTLLAKLL